MTNPFPQTADTETPKGTLAAHSLSASDLARALDTHQEHGLSPAQAGQHLAADGPNALQEEKPVAVWQVVAGQFASFLIAILIFAGVISLIVGEISDAIVILAIVLLNAALGAFQELRAEHVLEALKHAITPTARVVRGGVNQEIPAVELVVGDLVLLQSGDLAPSDLRLTQVRSLSVDESPLTGELVPVHKSTGASLEERTALGDRANCIFMGTSVAYGRGTGIVYATGMSTQLGQIARMVTSQKRAATPLQQRLDILGKQLGILALGLCGIVFLAGWLRGQDLLETFLVAVRLAVAAIPEGLPAVVTISLALGLQRMLKRHALIRRLAAVETLGAATVICTDKTGTLTRGEMAVERLYLAANRYQLDNGGLRHDGQLVGVVPGSPVHTVLLGAALCNDAILEPTSEGFHRITGSPTEVALLRAAQQLLGDTQRERYPHIAETPFDSQRKRMATAQRTPEGRTIVLVKGAPDVVLSFCSYVTNQAGEEPLDDAARACLDLVIEELASQAYRLLAVACRRDAEVSPEASAEALEQDLTFLGLFGLIDPPRRETPQAVARCAEAGIRTIMVTGDHAHTASTIARSVGILPPQVADGQGSSVLTGLQLDQLGPEELARTLDQTRVFARVAPSHKLRIVEALQGQNQVVAMTGDGSNDATALKRANTGIAMGIRGTPVSKVEWHQGELFPRVGFIVTNLVTNLSYPTIGIVRFYNGRGTAEQWIKEGKYALNWTRLSCHKFVANQVRLGLFVLAYNLGNFMRRLVLPEAMKHWSLTSLQTRMIKTGGRLVRHAGRLVFQLAEVLVSREMLGGILERIGRLRLAPG